MPEVDEAGSVPELVVENPLDARVLLYDGEELVGAKQNRILNVSVLVEARSTLTIAVSCVEEGRWARRSARFAAGSHVSHARLRRVKAEAQAAQPLARGVAQAEVWGRGARRRAACPCTRPTRARTSIAPTSATCAGWRTPSLRSRASAARSSGSGPDICLDLVSRPDAFARLWPKLRAGYLLDALEHLDGRPTAAAEIDVFVCSLGAAVPTRGPSAGLGEDVRLQGDRLVGSGLELEGELTQLSALRSEEGRRAFGRIARPSRRV